MRERITARVLLFDPVGRILLMKGRLPGAPPGSGGWFTLGGGVEAGETLETAAAREIVEETGFLDARVGRVAWTGEQIMHDQEGRPLLFKESYLIAHCAGGEPSREGWRPLEREFIDDIVWWTLAHLSATVEPVFPSGLAEKLAALPDRLPIRR